MRLTKPQRLVYDMEKYVGGSISVICGCFLMPVLYDVEVLKNAVNELFRLNDALRIRIVESGKETTQYIEEYRPIDVEVLHFENKEEFDSYAEILAKSPIDLSGRLCELKIIYLPDQSGALLKLHHIISDAWTVAMIANQFYSFVNGEEPKVYSYEEYIQSEDEYLQGKRYQKDREFHLQQFQKCDEILYLSDKESHSYESRRATFVVDKETTASILSYAKERKLSPFVLFSCALAVYFNRIKQNAEKFFIGTAVLNRTNVREKHTMGMFINTVPMLMELDNSASFAENLASVKSTAYSALQHQKFNYGDVLAELRKEFGFGEKLYDVMISYQNASLTGNGGTTTWYHSGCQTESLQMHIDDRDNEGILRIHYDYQTEVFTESEIERLHTHIMNLLLSGIQDERKIIIELDLLSEDERQKLLYDFNDTAIDYQKDKCVHQLFEEQVSKTPDKTAVIACDRTMTYAELDEEANRIAHGLIEQGVKQGDIVAICLPRRSFLISAMLGILKAGAAYLPIDPDYPQDRVDFMLRDSGAKLVISEEKLVELCNNEPVNSSVKALPTDYCYCVYTSGSTGIPKGTLLTHTNVMNYCNNNNNNVAYHIIKQDYLSIVSITTVSFDIFVTESILPLLNGIRIVLANEKQSQIQSELDSLLELHSADVIQTTPTKMKSLIADNKHLAYLQKIKTIILGGEALDAILVEKLQTLTSARIFNIYGPSETTVWVTNAAINTPSDITIGKPIANTQIYIVDKYMNPVPLGISGELCIAGDCVGAGYLNRPELTAEKFVDNPFGEGKLYKTGDLAYWREDGNIVYVGRNDFQVKIRGLRIELGEIENAISSFEGISQAVVVVRKNDEGRQLICAFYTGQEIEPKEIRAVIGKKLPKYMIPHIFTHLDAMPLTSSGKVSRKALPEVDLNATESAEYVAPRNGEETALADAVKCVLDVDKVSVLDSFFELGGDSLKAIELIVALEKRGYTTDVRTVFEGETIEKIAGMLRPAETKNTAVRSYPEELRITPAQMRVYTAQSMRENTTAYNVPYVFKVKEPDIDKLQNAVNALVKRHESLRTHFIRKEGNITPVIDTSTVCRVEILENDDPASFIRPFDLSQAPLMRVGICGDTVMIDMHHIITDGGSMPVFFHDLNELYMGRELPDSPVQYSDYSACQYNPYDDERFWLSVYGEELPELTLNHDMNPASNDSDGHVIYEALELSQHTQIKDFCKFHGITPYVFYMSAFYILLSKYSGNEDIAVGIPMSGRSPRFLNTIGMFVNTVPLRSKPSGEKTVNDYLHEVSKATVSAIEHQNYPYGSLLKKLDKESLFEIMFAYQSESMTDIIFGNEKAELLPVPITTAKYDITFNVMPRDNEVVLMAEYRTSLFRKSTIRRMIGSYRQILSLMLNDHAIIKEISAVTPDEMHKLLFGFNNTSAEYPKDRCIHQLIEDNAAHNPKKTAVVAIDRTLTYAQINEESNRIAHALLQKRIGKGCFVAVLLPRNSHLIPAILGVLKTGAAFLPLDPSYPQERIDYLTSECKAAFRIDETTIVELLNEPNRNNPDVKIEPDDYFCALHTSGSTGKPKLTVLRHRNLLNFLYANADFWMNVETVISVTIVTFDIFMQDSLLSLAYGKKVVLASNDQIFNQHEFEKLFESENHVMFFSTPTKLTAYIKQSKTREFMKKIRSLIVGGEVFTDELYDLLLECKYSGDVRNGYGPAETTIGVSYTSGALCTPPRVI